MSTEYGGCRAKVQSGFHRYACSRKAWRDGYCKQHHPESVAKRRVEQEKRYNERTRNREAAHIEQVEKAKMCDAWKARCLAAELFVAHLIYQINVAGVGKKLPEKEKGYKFESEWQSLKKEME